VRSGWLERLDDDHAVELDLDNDDDNASVVVDLDHDHANHVDLNDRTAELNLNLNFNLVDQHLTLVDEHDLDAEPVGAHPQSEAVESSTDDPGSEHPVQAREEVRHA
jgi:hypothetical protein